MSGRAVVLVVDDNEANLALAEFVLHDGGYEVHTAVDAASAMRAIRSARPQLILMDVQLPGIDGLELTRRLRAAPETAGIRILAVTSYAMSGDSQRALAAGCDGYVSKPIDTRGLLATVSALLEQGR